MIITLNGQPKDLADAQSLREIINRFCQDPRPVIAQVNGNTVRNAFWDETVMKDGDTVELVRFVGGGGCFDSAQH